MAKSQKVKKIGGPFLVAAVFCDSVVRGDDGVMSAVRMIDQVTLTIPGDAPSNVPSEDGALLVNVEGLITLRKGDSKPRHQLTLVMVAPSGKSKAVGETTAEFKDELHASYNLRMKSTIAVTETGLYWLDVSVDGKLMTRMPLLINVKRADPRPAAIAKPAAKGRKKKS